MGLRRISILFAAAALLGAAQPPVADLIIQGGTVYTGDAAPFSGDVAVVGDRIVAVGLRLQLRATRIIDARGLIVAPGFIDPHTHIGEALTSADPRERLVLPFLLQGVTTAFVGNDGHGTPDVAPMLAMRGTGINFAAYAGFGAIRGRVIGSARRAATPQELAQMQRLVARAMCDGALGLSTGLFYAPQSFADTAEVTALAAEAGRRGGVYDTHLRDESSYTVGLKAAVDEALKIGRAARVPVNISHIKALGVDVHGQAPAIIAGIEAARRAGQRVTADQYPWEASGTSLVAALVPLAAQDGGRIAMLPRLDDPATRAGMADNLRRRGGAAKLLITEGQAKGRTLAQVAGSADPVATAVQLIRATDAAVVSFNQDEADIALFMRQPWVMTGSDASAGHPRVYGSFARKYAVYVRQRSILSLRDFIDRSTALPADTFRIADRGRLKPGAYADVIAFDPRHYGARATYAEPTRLATGMRFVIVNGEVAVANGKPTGAAAGRALPHTPMPGSCP